MRQMSHFKYSGIILTLGILSLCAAWSDPAHAFEKLNFQTKTSTVDRVLIQKFLNLKTLDGYEIAEADLNNDGQSEFFVKTPECKKNSTLCTYKILAREHNKIVELTRLNAQNIVLGNAYSNGIRNLLIFDNRKNDFDYTLYEWQSQSATYAQKAKE